MQVGIGLEAIMATVLIIGYSHSNTHFAHICLLLSFKYVVLLCSNGINFI